MTMSGTQTTVTVRPVRFALNSAGTTNATLVYAGRCRILNINASNANAAVRHLKLYDVNVAPTAGGTSPRPLAGFNIPASGGVFPQPIGPHGLPMDNGIGITLVTGAADTDATAVAANDIKVVITYVPE
jgi:hypothetical protein